MTLAASDVSEAIPSRAGIGLRPAHYRDMLARRPSLAFLEVHSENYFGAGGPPHFYLEQLRNDYPLSLHGVGLSLGSTDPLDQTYLAQLKTLISRYQPERVSDHLCWTSAGGLHTHDLLPLPYTEAVVHHVASRIRQVQDSLGRRLLVENATSYIEFAASDMSEWDFVRAVIEEADCDVLLDVREALAKLPEHYRAPLLLQVLGGFSCQEIAAIMDASEDAMLARVSRARRMMREMLEVKPAIREEMR